MSNLRIFFLRHGQTEQSRENHFCGAGLNPGLTPDGAEMARYFAQAYRDTKWSALYASPLKRALTTMAPIADQSGLTPIFREDLKEIAYGEWEGKTADEVNIAYHDDYIRWTTDPAWCPPTGGETANAIAHRVMGVVTEIKERWTGDVLVVSHKATIRIALASLLGIDVGRFRFRLDCPVCSVSVVEFTKQGPWIRRLADRSHLPKKLQDLPGT